MCHPQPQPENLLPAKTKGDARGFDRRKPTAWFLAEIIEPLPLYGWAASGHVYVSRSEDGLYRVLRKGVAKLVSEGVARRHFRRVKGSDGAFVRVGQQRRWDDVFNEAMAESRRGRAA